jgi:hypothetical protein
VRAWRRRGRFGGAFGISLALHLALILLLLGRQLALQVSAVETDEVFDTEVVMIDTVPGTSARRAFDRPRTQERVDQRTPKSHRRVRAAQQPRRHSPRTTRSVRRPAHARATGRPGRAGQQRGVAIQRTNDPSKADQVNCLLSMRGCQRPARKPGSRTRGRAAGRERHASFWGGRRGRPTAPSTISTSRANGVKLVRYTDGSRLFSSTREGGHRRPDLGTVGLVDLAKGKVGGRSGRVACNPYRVPLGGKRTLVLMVDTSASVEVSGQSTKAVFCAAGAALAALARGYPVEVLNFSTVAVHQPPTRDREAIFRVLSLIQGSQTVLPSASRLVSASAHPRDFVLITDSAIGNLKWTLPTYKRAVATHRDNRAMLYLLGNGVVCPRCHYARNEICHVCSKTSRQTLVQLEQAGFLAMFVEHEPVLPFLARQLPFFLPGLDRLLRP